MTIAAYTGLPGHGKSYGVVENVIKSALEKKREVFTNIPMNSDECLKRFGMTVTQFKTDDIIENPNWWSEVFNPGAVIVIDELWRLWPSGLNAKNVRDEDKAFLAEHRHLVGENGQSTEVIFVTQDLSQIANFARSLVETTFRVTKLSKVGMDNRFRVDVYFGPVTGASPPVSKRDREIHGKFKKETYALYKSHTKSVTGEAGNENRIDRRYNALGGFGIKLGAFVVVIALVACYYGFKNLANYYGFSNPKPEQTAEKRNKQNHLQQIPPQPKKEIFQFLAKAEGFYINFNNGHFPNVDYRFKVVFDDMEATFTVADLARMEYSLAPINKCMVKVEGPDWKGFAMCQRNEIKKGWVESIVTESNGSDPM
jgi:zona occludens toxin